ncbi:hypothetical protein [Jiella pacifica]|uniref:Uncharacterized protein n=1 Tax=Jiella pacifica TaxID=2696469 RepID=A0A6N9T6S1_9HYPH|nr:hypothetical protein [Jiella pacifica]NDW04608.1 hypothetical protein [Jiella pacifica]
MDVLETFPLLAAAIASISQANTCSKLRISAPPVSVSGPLSAVAVSTEGSSRSMRDRSAPRFAIEAGGWSELKLYAREIMEPCFASRRLRKAAEERLAGIALSTDWRIW